MLSFEEFQNEAASYLREVAKNKYGEADVKVHKVRKINYEATGITIFPRVSERRLCPTVYLETFYKQCLNGYDLEDVLSNLSDTVLNAMEPNDEWAEVIHDYKGARDKIFFQFVNTKQNEELLETLPHREFHNLSIVYRWLVGTDEEGTATALISNQIADSMGLSEDELYDLAYKNARELFPVRVMKLRDAIKELIEGDDLKFDEVNPRIYVISYSVREYGATAILYSEELQKLAEQLGEDLYLLPSSLHEMVVVPESVVEDMETIADMVYENNQLIPIGDRLSNEVYKYDRQAQSIVQATNSGREMLVEDEEFSESQGMTM